MIRIRKARERGHAEHGWLDSWHTFSFADYHDPAYMGFRSLRVINDDTVASGKGFGTHGHQDMEIVTYVLSGALEHKDSLGNGSVMRYGEVQRMSAGTGIRHSEFNHSASEPVHFLQIWILPARRGLEPSYEQTLFVPEEKQGKLRVVASPDGREGSVTVHQDALLYAGLFDEFDEASHAFGPGRAGYLQVAHGSVELNGQRLEAGDGATIEGEPEIRLAGGKAAEVLLFDLA
ncbi:quercetin 2,3-dioxygenase [Novimethylophilus kurashikiensis]|uniref:Quercetin 2,3-dioxygenase n=1 Tax=Novimethylophilus kurashikiensis TaxID=1825523 RepID=A0A2R5FCM8_9PROT|nr:pirin family protein [Novimethylophilus kurashikiensis]GBG15765.1 quercetin 2,3-dioxygenase [Novimethylophilus kurashikiensis]